jgi:aspartyl protease family protein
MPGSSGSPGSSARRIGAGFTLAAWAVLLALLAWLAQGFLEQQYNPNPAPRARTSADGLREVVLQRNRSGHYVATGRINDLQVRFLVDTGATLVALDERLAARIGLEKGAVVTLRTAGGEAMGWRTLIPRIDLGGLVQYAVPAVIQPGLGDDVLLGMSFLKRVEFAQRDGALVLRSPP